MKDKKIEYESIKQSGGGEICLSIYPPKTFFGGNSYAVFVGGCGNGHKDSLKEAEEYLLERAIAHCDYQIEKAAKIIAEYTIHKNELIKKGLVKIAPK